MELDQNYFSARIFTVEDEVPLSLYHCNLVRLADCSVPQMFELQAPSVLAQLPRQLTEGKILFGPVYGRRASEKVKRYEIVAAVDGEAINIYNVRSRERPVGLVRRC